MRAWAGVLVLAGALVVLWPARRRLLARPTRRISLPAIDGRSRWVVAGLLGGAVITALLAGGPVAGAVVSVYAVLAGRALRRRAARGQASTARSAALDDLVALAADLRAGLPPAAAGGGLPLAAAGGALPLGAAGGGLPADRLARLTASVWRLAERTGAPAADLIERIEADARAADRAAAKAAAQGAGAQATAMLLAGLPLGGIGLGFGIGADPLRVLLHTPIGAACAVGAVLLQCGGLLWAERLATGAVR
jgi:tight adherence protein B